MKLLQNGGVWNRFERKVTAFKSGDGGSGSKELILRKIVTMRDRDPFGHDSTRYR